MTVSSTVRSTSFAGDGATVAFAFGFKIFLDADLKVTLRSSAGVDTVQTLATHYSVTGATNPNGGTVTMVTAPASGETLIIERDVSIAQLLNLRTNGDFAPESLEDALDLLTMIAQQQDIVGTVATFTIYTSTTKPTASSVYDGSMIIVRDASSAALLQVCMQKSDDTYDWFTVSSAGF